MALIEKAYAYYSAFRTCLIHIQMRIQKYIRRKRNPSLFMIHFTMSCLILLEISRTNLILML